MPLLKYIILLMNIINETNEGLSMASAKVYKGANRIEDSSLVGRTVTSILNDDVIVEALNLTDNDVIRVNGSTRDANYVVQNGDSVEFYKEQGRKG